MLLQRPIRKSLAQIAACSAYNTTKSTDSPKSKRFSFFRNSNSTTSDEFAMESTVSNRIEHQMSQRILCYRKSPDDLSLLEKIMKEPDSCDFIAFVWTECDFWRDPVALYAVNGKGQCLMDFVIDSGDDLNLFLFLIHDLKEKTLETEKSDKNYFLKIKTEIYMKITGMSIFTKIYGTMQQKPEVIQSCLVILNEILKEMKEICDIRREVKVDMVLSMQHGEVQEGLLRLLIRFWKVSDPGIITGPLLLSIYKPSYPPGQFQGLPLLPQCLL